MTQLTHATPWVHSQTAVHTRCKHHQPFLGGDLRPLKLRVTRRPCVSHAARSAAAAEAEEKQSPLSRLLGKGTQRLRVGGGAPGGLGSGTQRLRGGRPSTPARKDTNTVFLAGATGRLGARILRELLLADPALRVRAAARDAQRAQAYLDTAADLGLLPADAARRVSVVEVDLTQPGDLRAALGGASKVVQAIGAPESEAFNFENPKRIDGDAAIALVEAAKAAGVDQYVMVTSLGARKLGWPAGILNLFGGVLIQKRRAEVALEESGLPYVIVRPGGMERPGDDYKDTHNVCIAPRDTLFGGQVSRLQVAQLIAAAVANPSAAENKVLEVVAETEAPALAYEELLAGAECEEPQAERAERIQAAAAAKAELDAAKERVDTAKEAVAEAEAVAKQLAEAAARAKGEVEATRASLRESTPQLFQAQDLERQLESRRAELEEAQLTERAAKAVLAAATSAARQGRELSSQERRDAELSVRQPEEWAAQQEAARAERAKAEAKAREEAAEAQRRSNEEKARAALERAKRETEARLAADEQRARAAAAALKQAEADARVATQAQEKARAEAKAKAEAEKKRRAEEAQAFIKAQAKKIEEATAQAEAEKQRRTAQDQEFFKKQAAIAEEARKAAAARAEADEKARKAAAAKAEADQKAREEAAAKQPEPASAAAKPDAAPKKVDAAPTKGKNAEEARAWINSWHAGGSSAPAQGSNGTGAAGAEGGLPLVSDVGDGPLTWLQKLRMPWGQTDSEEGEAPAAPQSNGASATAPAAEGASGAPAPNVQEAREWIRQWRARTLEKALPKDVTAKQ